jgi:methylenetetrahydrofolate dehydrogenase (NADP+)/methenyltetrahydrofolate cyclohydrolase
MKIDGRVIAEEIRAGLVSLPRPDRFLAAILCGTDELFKKFVEQKKKAAAEVGVDFRVYEFPPDISGDKLRREVGRISAQRSCGGVIVQLPLPDRVNAQYVLNAIPPEKDIDVLGERALGAFFAGRGRILPPSVATAEEILRRIPFDVSPAIVAVVGAGRLIGKPVAAWLIGRVKELIVLDRGSDFNELRGADLVISGAGEPGLLRAEMLKDRAGVIDFGCGRDGNGKICGDLDLSNQAVLDRRLAFYTPTPGGTGPVLVRKVMENFYKLNM